MELAMENGYPVITTAGTFVHDARCAWFVEAVESWHEGLQVPRYDPGWFHASSLGKSDEELIAAYRGEAAIELHDAKKLRIFDLGHNRDAAWKRYIAGAGLSLEDDGHHRLMRVGWLRLTGECDEIVHDPDGRLCIIEVKTKNNHLFNALTEPDAVHVQQVQAYMGGMGIDQTIIVYENKNNQEIKAFYQEREPLLWAAIVTRLKRLRKEAEVDH